MIEWIGDIDEEKKLEFLRNLPIELKIKANLLREIYGMSSIIKNDEGEYEVWYYDGVNWKEADEK